MASSSSRVLLKEQMRLVNDKDERAIETESKGAIIATKKDMAMAAKQFFTSDTHAQVDIWIETHGQNYMAHAIWDDAVDAVMKSGHIKPSECVLRETGRVSYERGMYNCRGIDDIAVLKADLLEKKVAIPVSPFVLEDKIPLETAREFGIITYLQADMCREKTTTSITLYDNNEYKIVEDSDAERYIQSIPYISRRRNYRLGLAYGSSLDSLSKQYRCSPEAVHIAIEQTINVELNKQLAYLWKEYRKLIAPSATSIAISKFQRYVYDLPCRHGSLQNTIWVCLNSIAWSYGSVVALRGNPEALISQADKERRFLRYPFENENGAYSTMDLSHKDAIVIGPTNVLVRYKALAESRGIKLFYIEDMKPEQRHFFNEKIRVEYELVRTAEKREKAACEQIYSMIKTSAVPVGLIKTDQVELKSFTPTSLIPLLKIIKVNSYNKLANRFFGAGVNQSIALIFRLALAGTNLDDPRCRVEDIHARLKFLWEETFSVPEKKEVLPRITVTLK